MYENIRDPPPPGVGLQCLIVAFPGQTHLFFGVFVDENHDEDQDPR